MDPFPLYLEARPLTREGISRTLEQALFHEEIAEGNAPSLAQSLTRLQFLRHNLFKAEDWDELSWLIQEGTVLEAKRRSKHPLFKVGPRQRLQERVQHFHGRAAIKAVALCDALEPPLRRLASRLDPQRPLPAAPPLPWARIPSASPEKIGAPRVRESASLLHLAAPLVRHLIDLQAATGSPTETLAEAWEHFRWHAREAEVETTARVPFYRQWSHRTAENRLLRVALEHLQTILEGLREAYLARASGFAAPDFSQASFF